MMSILGKGGLLLSTLAVASVGHLHAAQLSERDQHAATQHFKRGMEDLLGERYETAEREFRDAVKIDPLYDAAFYGLGQVYMATKQFESAVKAYIAARDAFKSATAAESLASVSTDRRLRDQIDALKDYERNLTRQVTTTRSPAAQAAIDRIHDQILQMETRLHRTGGPPPPVPAGYSMALGSAYFRLNQLPDAEREYKAAIQVDPSFGEAHSNLAVVYFVTGRIAEADAALKAATKAGFKVNPRLKEDIEAAMKKRVQLRSSLAGERGRRPPPLRTPGNRSRLEP
jgi:tetratricopeptide (TPR) repeat protein